MRHKYTLCALLSALAVSAQPVQAQGPIDWGTWMIPAASTSAERIHDFHDLLFVIITGIVLFVLALLAFVILRFNKRANPTPSKTTHNVLLEVVWTIIPIVILIIIVVPSFKVLYKNDRIAEPEMTIKAIGYQWYWGYQYPDRDGLEFDSRLIPDEEIKGAQKRLLSTDNVVVVPIETDIALLVTANDVIHAWAVPAFGVKIDAIPLRTNETWFRVNKPGIYYGQCSEICGKDHSFMPIEVWAVPKPLFEQWAQRAKNDVEAAGKWLRNNFKISKG